MKLELDVREDASGRKFLHFPFLSLSDIHLGTHQSRARRLCGLLEHTQIDHLQLAGDIIDGEYLLTKKIWNWGPWHRQALGHFLRKAEQRTRVVFNEGNHESNLPGEPIPDSGGRLRAYRDLSGKSIFGVQIETATDYVVPSTGQRVRIDHGHSHDEDICSDPGKRRNIYRVGDAALEFAYCFDPLFRRLGLEFSVAAASKRAVKGFIERFLSVGDSINNAHDESNADVYVYGHTHMAGFKRTPERGKLVINDGCSTEHVQGLVHDADGNWAIIEWHKDRICVFEEGRKMHTVYWRDLGLDTKFGSTEKEYNDAHTDNADRVLRLVARMWPAKDRVAAYKEKRAAAAALKENQSDMSLHRRFAEAYKDPALKINIPRHRPRPASMRLIPAANRECAVA